MIKIDLKLLLMGAFFVMFFLRECHHSEEISDKSSDYNKMTNFYLQRDSTRLSKIHSNASDSIKMMQTIVEFENLSESLKEELNGYKEGASMVETVVKTEVNDIVIEIHDTLFFDQDLLDDCHYGDSLVKEFKKRKIFTFRSSNAVMVIIN